MKSIAATLLCFFLAAPVALAGETDWVELAPGVTARLVSSDTPAADGLWMGLEIDMPADTKTYWRVPGESGIPLSLDISASRDIAALEMAWPFPQRETGNGYVDHAYYGRVLLPFKLSISGASPRLDARVMLGICSEICIPASAHLVLAPDLAAPDSANGFRIRQALADVPLPIEGHEILGSARFDADSGTVMVDRIDAGFDPASMIAELDGHTVVFDQPRLSADGATIAFSLLGRIGPDLLDGADMRFSYQTSDGPYEVTRPLGD
ncbi:protein-disulfide reductase DsbD domain-containing protein [Pelagibacterium lacus]|uniref:Thiol:disulfide interchange protein DsbD N-terminal domain-containing protein n=1 Tax=Pelagibacterium lacus TaxID=2282655 RepID=A0A369W9E9_9HYPH|nr:protein-disulfide reductase DsbD domain-containing protein [Pelagibacterium lacus]RDE10619.1 hypothetical protein DVH29_01335 [Pelagibacterium lacus]